MQRFENAVGGYAFAAGIAPYSAGVVALDGFDIVRVALDPPAPWRDGFDQIDRFLRDRNRPRAALCGVELRLPAPLSFDGFAAFNAAYQDHLASWDLLVDGRNPVARTNVAPAVLPPPEASLHAFSVTLPGPRGLPPSFVVAGAGDLVDQTRLAPDAVVRPGDVSAAGLREKARAVLMVMSQRLAALGVGWDRARVVDVYCAHPLGPVLTDAILPAIGAAAGGGVCLVPAHPPIADLAFEMDVRSPAYEWHGIRPR